MKSLNAKIPPQSIVGHRPIQNVHPETLRRAFCIALAAGCALVRQQCLGDSVGFAPGDLLGTTRDSVYVIDPATGNSTKAYTTPGGASLGDVAYDRLSRSAFFIQGNDIFRLGWNPTQGFSTQPFVTGLRSPSALATDGQGNLYFNQQDFVNHSLWKADSSGNASRLTPSSFDLFVPTDMQVSPDDRELFIANSPSGNIAVFDLQSATLNDLVPTFGVGFPSGLALRSDGSLLVTDQEPGSPHGIVQVSPSGSISDYARQPWMEFMGTGFWGDIEYDHGNLYAVKGWTLYEITPDLSHRTILGGLDLNDLALVQRGSVPEGGSTLLYMVLPLSGMVALGRRLFGASGRAASCG